MYGIITDILEQFFGEMGYYKILTVVPETC